MITEFSSLYTGHIQMENIGKDGTNPNDRRYSNEQVAEALETSLELAQLMEELGYDTLWLAEHHFQHEGYECIPNILMLAVHLANNTKRIKIGCAFNIAPMWHPLRLAEDFAMADILTKGRVIFGVGRGYHTREVETFGVPMIDGDANRELFEEQMQVIFKAFNEDSFSHKGKHYTIPPAVPYRGYELERITMVPRPVNRPVDVWQPIVSGSARSLEFMSQHGIKGLISGTAEQFTFQWIQDYQEAANRYGRQLTLGENIALGYRIYLDKTAEKAIEEATPYFEEHAKFAAPLGMLRYSEEQMKKVSARQTQSTNRASLQNGAETKVWLCGPPKEFITYLRGIEERFPGMKHILVSSAMSTPVNVMKEQLTRFAEGVMPAFKTSNPS